MELGRFFGFLHPALVHFPLVLLLVSVGLEAVGFFKKDTRFHWAAQVTLLLGSVAMLFAFVCGNFAEIWAARDGIPQDPMEQHELLATITSWLFVFLAAGRLFLGQTPKRHWMALYLCAALAGCILLGITGHRGAMLVYQHGAGVQTGSRITLPTHEDLAVLRQKQDPEALFYSDKMHHIFGWMVLLLSGLLLVDTISPKAGEKLRKIGPLLLLAGGMYLLIYSDTDSWPLSSQRSLLDKEILMHKIYATLMLVFGIAGLWKGRRKKQVSQEGVTSERDAGRAEKETDRLRRRQGRNMAVFALIGGALLFTHVHSNAPYANVAAGVYLHHTVMGFVALMIGAVKLLEDALRERRTGRLARTLAWAYPGLMLIQSIFLLNYNEGLPWFLGYGGLSLNAPHRGLIAPLGADRAELTFDPLTSRLDLYLLGQSDNRPRPISAGDVQAIVRVGTDATAIPLTVCPDPVGNFHFSGTATYLQGASTFQTQALVTEHTGSSVHSRLADFEPWIDERLAVGQHSQAAYICPHHPSVGSGAPGHCGVCGMAFVPNRPARPEGKLHDDAYRMDLALSASVRIGKSEGPLRLASNRPIRIADLRDKFDFHHTLPTAQMDSTPEATVFQPVREPLPGQHIRLNLTLRHADGRTITALETVHTKKLHLIIASRDLSFFDHVHPELQRDGSLQLDYVFPRPGEYLLYADCTPIGDRNQVFRLPVTVGGAPPAPALLLETPAQAKTVGNYRLHLDISPSPIQARDEAQLTFVVSENGIPVTDLEPFLGAGGHCVILSEDTNDYLHSHPLETKGSRFGPSITFHTVIPHPGLYKVWGQFLHHGKPLTVDFVIRCP